ncbi:MAG TPA: UPF0182 family protein [Gemmatimonadales bacterium]|nr:UPF0182 family protein [Gemmatimonadales bacterium]
MSPRTVRLILGVTLVVGLLFLGRWTAGLLADRWWASQVSPAAAAFVTDWTLVRVSLEAIGVVTACAWFVGHLLVVYRAIGSVQIHRQLGNLEIREAINTRVLEAISIAAGFLLGLVVGQGVGEWAPEIILALRAVPYGQADPLLGRDIGFYVTRLPFWRLLHGHLLLLVLLALAGVLALYVVIGAVAWRDRRPAINGHARAHLGLLSAMLALVILWGHLLEPSELVAGVGPPLHDGLFEYRTVTAQVLAGPALAAAVLSLVWVWRGQHTLMAAGWILVFASSLLGRHIVPALSAGGGPSPVEPAVRRRFDQLAYGMVGIRDSSFLRTDSTPAPPRPAGLWPPNLVPAATGDSGRTIALDRALLPAGRRLRPVWLVVRSQRDESATVRILADNQTEATGRPLLIQQDDTLALAGAHLQLALPARAVWPGPRDVVLDSAQGGVEVGTGLRRIALAWALQRGALLGGVSRDTRAFWYLDPVTRLTRLAPFAVWGTPVPRLVGGELVWLSDGYLASATFPASARVRWRGQDVGSLRAAFVGVVRAGSGATRIFLRHTADDVLGKAWRSVAEGLIEPASAIPPEIGRAVPYPLELLAAQSQVLEHDYWGIGRRPGGAESAASPGPRADAVWEPDSSGVQYVIPFVRPPERQVSAVLRARMVDGWETLRIVRLDSIVSLPEAATLDNRWARFPTFQQLRDSVERSGARLESSPVRYWLTPAGLGAYQTHFAIGQGQEPVLVWLSVALADRRGAGHDLDEAWQNLLGVSAPLVSAAERGVILQEARRHLMAAESALRRGDLEAFARAFEALRRTLRPETVPTERR